MPAPTRPDDDPIEVLVPFTLGELARILELARADGLSVPEYIRACVFPGEVDPVELLGRRLVHHRRVL